MSEKPDDYKLTVQLHNRDQDPIIAKWRVNGTDYETKIPAGRVVKKTVTVRSTSQPPPVMFTAVDEKTDMPGTINGKNTFAIQPRLNGYFSHVYVTLNGKC